MKIPKIIKLVHIPLASQSDLEAIKETYGITHTDVIVRGIQLAKSEITAINDETQVGNLYGINKSFGRTAAKRCA